MVVVGTTVTTPARLSFSGSTETTTAGRLPDCSRPTGSPKSTSHTSPLLGFTTSGLPAPRSHARARPRARSMPPSQRAAPRSEQTADRRTRNVPAHRRPRLPAELWDDRLTVPTCKPISVRSLTVIVVLTHLKSPAGAPGLSTLAQLRGTYLLTDYRPPSRVSLSRTRLGEAFTDRAIRRHVPLREGPHSGWNRGAQWALS